MKRINLLLVLGSLFMVGCVTSQPQPIVSIPKEVESSLPTIKETDKKVDNSIAINKKIDDKIVEQKKIVIEQKIAIEEAISQAEKIKEKALANEAIKEIEALNLLDQLKKVHDRNLFLETQNTEMKSSSSEQERLLNDISKSLDLAREQIINKENETASLRESLNLLIDKNKQHQLTIDRLHKDLDKAKRDLASAQVYKNWVIGLVLAFVAWTIIKNVIMMYNPIKFRL